MNLDREDIEDILQLIDSSQYDQLSLKTDRFSLRMNRTGTGVWQAEQHIDQSPTIEPLAAAAGSAAAPSAAPLAPIDNDGMHAVCAPLPGTFYRAPRPGAEPFVKEGDSVSADTVVCIVETMKLMNSVQAGVDGTVTRILIENGAMTEQGAPMVLIEPAS